MFKNEKKTQQIYKLTIYKKRTRFHHKMKENNYKSSSQYVSQNDRSPDDVRKYLQSLIINIPQNYQYNNQSLYDATQILKCNQKITVDENQNLQKCMEIMNENNIDYLFITSSQGDIHTSKDKNLKIVGIAFKRQIQVQLHNVEHKNFFKRWYRRCQQMEIVPLIKKIMFEINIQKVHFKLKTQDEKILKNNWKMFKTIANIMLNQQSPILPIINSSHQLLGVLYKSNCYIGSYCQVYNPFSYSIMSDSLNSLINVKNDYSQKIRDFQEMKQLFVLYKEQQLKFQKLKSMLKYTLKLIKQLEYFQYSQNNQLWKLYHQNLKGNLSMYFYQLSLQSKRKKIIKEYLQSIASTDEYATFDQQYHKGTIQIIQNLLNRIKQYYQDQQKINSDRKLKKRSNSFASSRSLSKNNDLYCFKFYSLSNHAKKIAEQQWKNQNLINQLELIRKKSTQQQKTNQPQKSQSKYLSDINFVEKKIQSSSLSTSGKSSKQDLSNKKFKQLINQAQRMNELKQDPQQIQVNQKNIQKSQQNKSEIVKNEKLIDKEKSKISQLNLSELNSRDQQSIASFDSNFSCTKKQLQKSKILIQLYQVIKKEASISIELQQFNQMIDNLPTITPIQNKEFNKKYDQFDEQIERLQKKHQFLLKKYQEVLIPEQYQKKMFNR